MDAYESIDNRMNAYGETIINHDTFINWQQFTCLDVRDEFIIILGDWYYIL